MPFNDTSREAINGKVIHDFDSYISDVSDKKCIEVIKKIHCLDSQYFGDQSHVYSGSGITTRQIIVSLTYDDNESHF